MKLKTLLILPLLVASLQAASISDLTFTQNDAGTEYSVTGCVQSASGSLDIPSTYNGLPVTSIGTFSFPYCPHLTSITIPNSVTSIGTQAFYQCTGLTSITIPGSVISIGRSAFSYCSSLTSITIPGSVTSIESGAFSYCSSLTSITIPDGVTSIGGFAFQGCSYLTSITIPDGVTSIEYGAFSYCSSLTSITIPDSVTSIGDSAFDNCSNLTSVTIGDSVTSIGDDAFEDTGLTFEEDTNSIKYLVSNSGNTAYLIDGSSSSGNVILPNTLFGSTVALIGDEAFEECTNLTSITIPDSVTSIGRSIFKQCTGLTSITIPNSVTSIGNEAFYECSSLISITIPDSVTSIGDDAFYGCTSLTSITIPYTVISIGNEAFYECTSLTSITLPYKFAGSAGLFGIPGDAEITANFNDVSEGLLANTNFVAGISQEVTFDSSAVDQAIADEAQARADADVLLQANIDAVAVSMQSYVDSAVAQARADGVTAGIQSVTSDPQSYQLYNESSIMEMNVSNPTLSMLNESEQAQVEFTLETSTDLEDWNIEERIQRTVQATGDKFFVRIKSGAPYVTPTVLVFNHPSYGEILTDQSGNVLYGLSFDSVGGDPIYSGAAWPLAPQIADPEPDAGVTAALTSGTFSNTSGGPWLKVNNRPVYTYASDSEPNQATGQNSGTVWFTIKPDGTLNQ